MAVRIRRSTEVFGWDTVCAAMNCRKKIPAGQPVYIRAHPFGATGYVGVGYIRDTYCSEKCRSGSWRKRTATAAGREE